MNFNEMILGPLHEILVWIAKLDTKPLNLRDLVQG